ncbi:MAG TPA: MBL fold metallo-hydrolase RNA specificity domain-containing protein [Thermoplasmata archaeon]|nr:MBL fold metallo-hydrolase RNA specificity domain-containing protein [Thermoplasmata archaeon]
MGFGWDLTVFDGHASIGGTKMLLAQGGERLLLDFGTNYKRESQFFEEYLKPRSIRGLVDYIALGLLPAWRGLYRRDLFPSADFPNQDADWAGSGATAVLLTHGHLDHAGGIAFLDPSIPVLASPLTLALLRSWQETGGSTLTSEVTYYAEKSPNAGGTPGASVAGRTVRTARGGARRGRSFQLFGELPGGLREALRRSPYGPKTEFEPLDPTVAGTRRGDLAVAAFTVDHSVYGATAFTIDGDGGRFAYTGDFRSHGDRGPETERFLRELESDPPDVLVAEGTRLRSPGDDRPQSVATEDDVERKCREEVASDPRRLVVADFGPRNIERLRRFRRIALDTGRQLVVTPKDAYLLRLLHAADPTIEVDIGRGGLRIYEKATGGTEFPWLHTVRAEFADAFVGPAEIAGTPGRWILCFSYFDCSELVDLRRATPGGLWLYSSSESHGEEQEFDFVRLAHWIDWAGLRVVGFRLVPDASGVLRPSFDHPEDVGHHASGHATEEELLAFVRRANPRFLVPVHTEQSAERYAALLERAGATCRVVPPTPGAPVAFP